MVKWIRSLSDTKQGLLVSGTLGLIAGGLLLLIDLIA